MVPHRQIGEPGRAQLLACSCVGSLITSAPTFIGVPTTTVSGFCKGTNGESQDRPTKGISDTRKVRDKRLIRSCSRPEKVKKSCVWPKMYTGTMGEPERSACLQNPLRLASWTTWVKDSRYEHRGIRAGICRARLQLVDRGGDAPRDQERCRTRCAQSQIEVARRGRHHTRRSEPLPQQGELEEHRGYEPTERPILVEAIQPEENDAVGNDAVREACVQQTSVRRQCGSGHLKCARRMRLKREVAR
eukprot:scaffold122101_cov34-Tisochrysis_lutea.AAC.3